MRFNFGWLFVLVCIVCCIAAHDLISKEELENLRKQLERVAGVFEDQSLVKKYNLKKTVLVTGCNHGFLNHLFNFDCFAQRLGMKYLVITMDNSVEGFLRNHTNMVTFPLTGKNDIGTAATEFRSRQFNLITARKKAAVHSIMQLGYDVLFSDTDVAILRDPFPYLLWENVDYVHSLNGFCQISNYYDTFWKSRSEGNTGFYYVRSTPQTLKLWEDAFAAAPKSPKLDDQAIFWNVIRRSKDPVARTIGKCHNMNPETDGQGKSILLSCILDACVFNSGALSRFYTPEQTYETVMSHMKLLNESVVTVHANYISGNEKKMKRMKEHNLWLAEYDLEYLSAIQNKSPEETNKKKIYSCKPYEPLPADWKYPEIQPMKE